MPRLLIVATLATLTISPPARDTLPMTPAARVDVRVDARQREAVVTVGPFRVEQSMPMHGMDMMMMQRAEFLAGTFAWPLTARFHGVRLAVVDGQGAPLPRRLLHHTYMVNFDRRQLVYPIIERSFSFGEETEDLATPATIGMPMARGQRMGILIMWDNETGHDLDDVYVRYTFRLNPQRQQPAPLAVMPFFVDVSMVAGGADTFSVAPGGRSVTTAFTVPVSGRLIAASGHLHDHALDLRLVEADNGKVLVTVRARREADGHVTGVSRELLGVWQRGPHLRAGRRYELVVRYDNPGPDTLPGMMGMMGGLFVPDDLRSWPRIDSTNADYLADLRGLRGGGASVAAAHPGGHPPPR